MECEYGVTVANKYNFLLDEEEDPFDLLENLKSSKTKQTITQKQSPNKNIKLTSEKQYDESSNKAVKFDTSKDHSQYPKEIVGTTNIERLDGKRAINSGQHQNVNTNNPNRDVVNKNLQHFSSETRSANVKTGPAAVRPGKREMDRHSGSTKTGVKSVEKRYGGGAYNWGTIQDDIEAQRDLNDSTDKWADGAATPVVEQVNLTDPKVEKEEEVEPTNDANSLEKGDDKPVEMTLSEYKVIQKQCLLVPQYNMRRAGEGEDKNKWQKGHILPKKKEKDDGESSSEREDDGNDDNESENEEEEDDQLRVGKKVILPIDIKYRDEGYKRGRGRSFGPARFPRDPNSSNRGSGFRGRGSFGNGRGGGATYNRSGNNEGNRQGQVVENVTFNENDFPSLL